MPELQVIGAGLGRTGTTSLKLALEQLGHKVYHMTEVHTQGDGDLWMELSQAIAAEDEARTAAAKDRIAASLDNNGFTATTDYPTCTIYQDHMERYPEAKVILSVRSSPTAWATSVTNTIYKLLSFSAKPPIPFIAPDAPDMARLIFMSHGLLTHDDAAQGGIVEDVPPMADLEQAYIEWVDSVKATVPAENLLIHNAKDVWAPLCAFLGVDQCPTSPYPRSNSSQDMKLMVQLVDASIEYFWPFVFLFLSALLAGIIVRPAAGKTALGLVASLPLVMVAYISLVEKWRMGLPYFLLPIAAWLVVVALFGASTLAQCALGLVGVGKRKAE